MIFGAQVGRSTTELLETRGGNQAIYYFKRCKSDKPLVGYCWDQFCQYVRYVQIQYVKLGGNEEDVIVSLIQSTPYFYLDVNFLFPYSLIAYNIFLPLSVMYLFHFYCICSPHLNVFPTGPLLHENLAVQKIPFPQHRELSVQLSGKDMSYVSDNRNIT